MDYAWTCPCCGKQFDNLPLSFGVGGPDQWNAIPENERATRCKKMDDICIIDDKDNFVHGCLEIPILGREETFVWGAWVSVSDKSLKRILELWSADDADDEPPFFGWLCNTLSLYPNTLGLATNVHLRSGNRRPLIELEPTDHPFAVEQRGDPKRLANEKKVFCLLNNESTRIS